MSAVSRFSRRCTPLFAASALFCASAASVFASSQPMLPEHGINIASGNKYLEATDIVLEGPVRLEFRRSYNSQSTENGVLGYGWSSPMLERLEVDSGGASVTLVEGTGRHVGFTGSSGVFSSVLGRKETITAQSGGGHQLVRANREVHTFDGQGRLTGIAFPNGTQLTYTYNNAGQVASVADSLGRSLTFTYTSGKLTGMTTPAGNFGYNYDANGNLTGVTRQVDNTTTTLWTYAYAAGNDVHNLTGVTDAANTVLQTLTYDSDDRVVTSKLSDNKGQVTLAYTGDLTRTVTDAANTTSTYELDVTDGVGRVKTITGPGCTNTCTESGKSYTYTSRQQVATATDRNDVVTGYTYDANGNLLSRTEAQGTALARTTTYTYTANNQVQTITEPSAAGSDKTLVTTFTYDSQGNVTSRVRQGFAGNTAISETYSFTYNTLGQLTGVDGPRTDVNDTLTLTYYPDLASQGNNRAQLQSVTNGLNQTTTYSNYTALGKPGLITEPSGLQTTLTYDARGNVLTRAAGGLTTSYSYDAAGRLLTITLPGNRVQTVTYSGDRVATITDALGNSVNLTYDAVGRLSGQALKNASDTTTYSLALGYDTAGNLNSRTYADNAVEQYLYDNVRNLTQETDPLNIVTTTSYDALRRVLSIARAGQTNATLGYDAQDNVVSVTDARNHTTTSAFDNFGNERSVASPDSGTTTSTYDATENLAAQTNAKNETVSITWDALNRPTQVSWPNAARNTLLVWDQNRIGALAGIQEEEFERAFTYDSLGRVTAETITKSGASVSIGYTYSSATGDLVAMTYPSGNVIQFTRDANGQISAIQAGNISLATEITRLPFGPIKSEKLRGVLPLTRTFDQRYQMSRIQAGNVDVQYTRDAAGRVTNVTGIAEPTLTVGTEAYGVNSANNQMTARGTVNYTYDAAGNLVSDGTRTFTWDALGRLKQVQQGNQTVATYGYDIQNRRFRKTVGSTTTYYLYNLDDQLVAEISGSGTVLREYVWLDGEPFLLAEYTGTNAGMYFYVNDHLGTPQQLLNGDTGAVAWQAAYLPFGEAQVQVSTVTNNLRFPGQYYDAEIGMHYNWNRYYDPKSGRYISADPVGFEGGLNLYEYANGDPSNLLDVEGLAWCIYSIKKHTLRCWSLGKYGKKQVGHLGVFSGNNTVNGCRNNPDCLDIKNVGPIQPGEYEIVKDTSNRRGRENWYHLRPTLVKRGIRKFKMALQPYFFKNFSSRDGFAFHLGTLSDGCITVNKYNIVAVKQFEEVVKLLDSEQKNTLTVIIE